MNIERMVRMANDIGNFFKAEPDHVQAVEGVRNHIKRFWDPRMRKQILEYVESGGDGLSDIAREAILKLR